MKKSLVAAALFLAACASEGDGADGLTILSADAELGISGMYQEGDRVVFFETVTTGVHEDENEGVTVLELSARFADQDGGTILAIHQGHSPDGWDDVTRLRAADLVNAAIEQLEGAELPQGAELHLAQLLRLRADALEMADSQATVVDTEVGYTTWQQRAKLYKRCIGGIADWLCPGTWHTGSKLYRYQNGAQVSSTTFCNHGGSGWCPGDRYMGQYCDKYGPTKSSESELVGIGTGRKCQSSYTWSSVGGHNCNDDTKLQARAAINNIADDKSGGYCSDSVMMSGNPSCGWF